ncbi:hypothetical protein GCK72_010967 [Caenorhabditis remanei]|uniref:Uncharacterized protein n=1 Tax=Caenorhabditis remanei TaxID=31234 RepID=A0A6A5H6I6_CAERE|nr:hypothetical protein GCK72_010967 [Caenorhabditis remanei]KAF1762705.1 hypothetical protein GCK72_010967 [Caenorhabditis remanei]
MYYPYAAHATGMPLITRMPQNNYNPYFAHANQQRQFGAYNAPIYQSGPSTKTYVHQCPALNATIFKVVQRDGYSKDFRFDSKTQKMVQPPVTVVNEGDLYPEYGIFSDRLQKEVMIAFNRVTSKMEQYIYSLESGQFEQVEDPDLKYHVGNRSPSSIVMIIDDWKGRMSIEKGKDGSVKKMVWVRGQWIQIPSRPVKTLEESEDVGEEAEKDPYTRTLPQYKIRYCHHLQKEVIFYLHRDDYLTFAYDETTREMREFQCHLCPRFVSESHLFPRYSEFSTSLNTHVIHVWNTETQLMEKYIYDASKFQFQQIYCPEAEFNPEKSTSSSILFVASLKNKKSIVMRGNDGRLKKEGYCMIRGEYVNIPPNVVRTFLVQRKEQKELKLVKMMENNEIIGNESEDLEAETIETTKYLDKDSSNGSSDSEEESSDEEYSQDSEDEDKDYSLADLLKCDDEESEKVNVDSEKSSEEEDITRGLSHLQMMEMKIARLEKLRKLVLSN